MNLNQSVSFSGPVKQVINGSAFITVFVSYSVMQLYIQWQTLLLRRHRQEKLNVEVNDILKKTGLFTLLIVLVALGQFLFTFAVSGNGQSYHLAKDLVSTFLLFVIIPIIIILNNIKISKYIMQYFCESEVYLVLSSVHFSVLSWSKMRSKIHPDRFDGWLSFKLANNFWTLFSTIRLIRQS